MNGIAFLDVLLYELQMSTITSLCELPKTAGVFLSLFLVEKFIDHIGGLKTDELTEINLIDKKFDANDLASLRRQARREEPSGTVGFCEYFCVTLLCVEG